MTLVYKPSLRQADGLSRLVGSRVAITLTSVRCSLDRGIVACGAVVADVALVAVAALPDTLIGHVPVGVPPKVKLPLVVTVPVSVKPP